MPTGRGGRTSYCDAQQHYTPEAARFKARAVRNLTARQQAGLVYDLGANTGRYSQEVVSTGAYCVAFDSDPDCVNRMYTEARDTGNSRLLPLVMDVLSPTPAIGLGLEERASFPDRARADLTLALALIHHLRIEGQAPLARIAAFLARITDSLLIEFIPKSDPIVAAMLRDRPDTFDDLKHDGFLGAFGSHFTLEYRVELPGTSRLLCLYNNRRGRTA